MPTDKRVWHYGYAQNSQIVGWKWDNVRGHKNELRRDVNWYQTFLPIGSLIVTRRLIDAGTAGGY